MPNKPYIFFLLSSALSLAWGLSPYERSHPRIKSNSLPSLIGSRQFTNLVWFDEFDNGIGSDWIFDIGGNGWGNNELQYYRRENAFIENGFLIIAAKRENFGGKDYTSARLKTHGRKSWRYGRIEARIRVPLLLGARPSFW
jgi:beta-glucanase (GH16 family)